VGYSNLRAKAYAESKSPLRRMATEAFIRSDPRSNAIASSRLPWQQSAVQPVSASASKIPG
jgi:hypothetical protein